MRRMAVHAWCWKPIWLVSLCTAGSARATIAFEQAAGANSNGSSLSTVVISLPSATQTTHTGIVVVAQSNNAAVVSVSDNGTGGGSQWSRITSVVDNGNQNLELWATPPGGLQGGCTAVTVSLTGGAALTDAEFGEYNGVVALGATFSSTALTASLVVSAATTQPDDWVVAGFAAHGADPLLADVGNLRENENTRSQPSGSVRYSALTDNTADGGISLNALTMSSDEPWNALALVLHGTAADAGIDAGSVNGGSDSGSPADAGGPPDAGTAPAADAGLGTDGGADPLGLHNPNYAVGCGCQSGAASVAVTVVSAVWLRRIRNSRSRRCRSVRSPRRRAVRW
jgi:hypothetical protein